MPSTDPDWLADGRPKAIEVLRHLVPQDRHGCVAFDIALGDELTKFDRGVSDFLVSGVTPMILAKVFFLPATTCAEEPNSGATADIEGVNLDSLSA